MGCAPHIASASIPDLLEIAMISFDCDAASLTEIKHPIIPVPAQIALKQNDRQYNYYSIEPHRWWYLYFGQNVGSIISLNQNVTRVLRISPIAIDYPIWSR